MITLAHTAEETYKLGSRIGRNLNGGEVLELIGDLGSGKTTLIKGIAEGLGVTEAVSSPTFTINRVYDIGDKRFYHFDFYRIDSSDIVALELSEAASEPKSIVAVEWAEHAKGAMPADRLTIKLRSPSENKREIELTAHGKKSLALIGNLQ